MDSSSRRRFLATLGAGAAAGLAGCGGEQSAAGDSTGGGSTPTPEPTTTAATDPFCDPLTGAPTAADTAGTPFVFTFEYVDSWTLEEPFVAGGSRARRIVSPELTSEDGVSSATVRVAQSLEPVTAATAEANLAEQMELTETNGITYETEFNGETVEFAEFPNVDVRSYTAYLPYGGGEERYYSVGIVTFIEGGGPGRNIGDCTDAVDANTLTVRDSLAVNPETTIDEL